jgi:hypothetical protein
MASVPRHERRLLIDCAVEGLRLLDAHFDAAGAGLPLGAQFLPTREGDPVAAQELLYSGNSDHFYMGLAVLLAADKGQAATILKGRDIRADLDRALEFTEATLYRDSEFDRLLAEAVSRNSELGDDDLRAAFSRRFGIARVDLTALPRDRSIFFAKVNHGYWEYMRSSYDAPEGRADQFRKIDLASKIRRLRTSGTTQAWGRQIRRMFMQPGGSLASNARLCVSLTTGTEPCSVSIRKELLPVTRGAAAGMLSLFETAVPEVEHFELGDGGATRALIIERSLESFFRSHVQDSEACVFVVPQHLRQVELAGFSGRTYKFMVPPTRINEAWRVVGATLLGYLAALGRKHRTITVLAQGASVASLLGLLFADLDPLPGVRLRYFDLGRVLDVAAPEFLRKQGWAVRNWEQYVAEGAKVFRFAAEADCALASAL